MSEPLQIRFPEELPVSAVRDEIAEAIRAHQVVVIAGETGSGKTTQLPKICLSIGQQRIGHTQPRRIAARSVAERIAEELGVELGALVGYQVRFTDKSSKQTRIKLMTDGILLNELQHDRMLSAYDTLIIDEAHERSLNIDFILGYLKQLLPRRPDLKVIITSATIDPDKLARHFQSPSGEPAPIIEVSGRTYPVEIRYRPLVEELDAEGEDLLVRDPTEAVVDAVQELLRVGPGDILVFLPGEREIRDLADVLSKSKPARASDSFEVLPLYGRLSAAEQHRVFDRHTNRRVVLATNVAETSLTVPGITYVVDTGLARISRYSLRSKVQRLPIEPISQASASQRSGRCGRVEAGVAIRLYSEEDFETRPEFTDPEVLRTNLASVILQMTALGLGDMSRFPFVDPPDNRQITAGVQLLEELGALTTGGRAGSIALTKVGRDLARIPVDPRVGRMILAADKAGCLREVIVIAAALSIPDPRERPLDHQQQADAMHARFRHEQSDFITLLNLWRYVMEKQDELSSSAFRRMCREEHLNYLRIREWQELEQQLRRIAKDLGLSVSRVVSTRPSGSSTTEGSNSVVEERAERASKPRDVDEDGIHQALLAGLLSHIGLKEVRDRSARDKGPREKTERRGVEYLGARNTKFAIFPGSGLAKKQPELVMAAELVETSRLFARVNAAIKPEWAEQVGAHLIKRSFSEPHWSKRRAAVMGYERVTLYGVPLIADRLTSYTKADPATARELFIRHALVYGEWETRHHFFHDNRAVLQEAEELEHRARRKDIVVDEHTLFDFYDQRIPADIVSGAHFDAWWKRERHQHPDLLTFDPKMVVREDIDRDAFPDEWHEGSLSLPIRYHFAPGTADDGVTVDVPVTALNQVPVDSFSWQVPGLREGLVIALLRSLPKQLRTSVVPIPDFARDFLTTSSPGEESLLDALERFVRSKAGAHVPREAWDWSKVPPHLRPTFRVVEDGGTVVSEGKDLAGLRSSLSSKSEQAISSAAAGVNVTGQTSWTFGTIDETFSQARAGHEVVGYPGLVDEGASVGLQVFGSQPERDASHLRGQWRLLALAVSSPIRAVADDLSQADKLALAAAPYPSIADVLGDCVLAAVATLAPDPVWDTGSFDRARTAVSDGLESETREVVADVLRALEEWRKADRALSGRVDLHQLPALSDMQAQAGRLVYRGFISDIGRPQLGSLVRYFRAIVVRREALDKSGHRDQELMDQVANIQESYLHRVAALPSGRPPTAALTKVRWMIEEFRVSLWAQSLGTAEKVSDARIRKALALV